MYPCCTKVFTVGPASMLWAAGDTAPTVFPYNPPPEMVNTFYGTGLDDNHQPLADGATDSHWTNGTVVESDKYPFVERAGKHGESVWHPNKAAGTPPSQFIYACKWIGPQADMSTFPNPTSNTDYVYATTFDLTGYNYRAATLLLALSADNGILRIVLNGHNFNGMTGSTLYFGDLAITVGAGQIRLDSASFTNETAVPFKQGSNLLQLTVRNIANNPHADPVNPTGLYCDGLLTAPPNF